MTSQKTGYKPSATRDDSFGDDDDDDINTQALEEKNPFSFKKFINTPTQQITNDQNRPKPKPPTLPDIDSTSNLTQDSKNDKNPFSFKHFIVPEGSNDLPVTNNLTCDVSFSPPTPSSFLPSPPDFRPDHKTNVNLSECQVLPDFLNESLLKDVAEVEEVAKATRKLSLEMPSYFDLESNLNDDLLPETGVHENMQKVISEQTDRISHLEKKIKQLKRNEANENRALETMIQQVEENLVKTTKRAVESERNAEKMKLEIKQLKAQVSHLNTENHMLKQKSHLNDETESVKLADFAQQLNGAATNAEVQLKHLLSGCETLRLVAASLDSFGKIKEMNETDPK